MGVLNWTIAPREAIPKIKALEERALTIDPDLGTAHQLLAGFVLWEYDWNWDGAEREFKRALELDPGNALTHLFYGDFLGSMGRFEEASKEAELARQLDPLDIIVFKDSGDLYSNWHRCDRAMEYYQQIIDMAPESPLGYLGRGGALICKAAAATTSGFEGGEGARRRGFA